MPLLDRSHKIPVRLSETLKMLVRCGDEGFAFFPFSLLPRIMESFEVSE
jgi:hypothetical protein